MLRLGYKCASSSRWPQNLHSVRHSKLENFFTHLPSRKVGRFSHVVAGIIQLPGDNSMHLYTDVFQRTEQIMQNHVDVQRLSHGSCIVDSSEFKVNTNMTVMERIYVDHRRNNMRIHTNHIREYQSQLWKYFSSYRTFQNALSKKGAGCEHTLQALIHIKELFLDKQRSEKKSEDSMVSRTH